MINYVYFSINKSILKLLIILSALTTWFVIFAKIFGGIVDCNGLGGWVGRLKNLISATFWAWLCKIKSLVIAKHGEGLGRNGKTCVDIKSTKV